MLSMRFLHQRGPQPHRTRPIIPDRLNASGPHRLKPDHHSYIDNSTPYKRPCELKPGRACRASVIGVVDGDVGHAELIEDALAGCRVAKAVACHSGLDIVVRDVCVEEGFCASFEA